MKPCENGHVNGDLTMEDEEQSYDESVADDEELDDEDFEEPEEWQEEEPETSNTEKSTDGCQKEFKVLGQQDFHTLSKINVTSAWVENATKFPAELSPEHLTELSSVAGIPKKLFRKVREEVQQWFPVQKAVLPILLKSILEPPILRPRDVTISAPTGSGKTLCYVLPALTMVGKHPRGELTVLVLVPVQTLVKQIEQEFNRFNAYKAQITALSGAEDIEKEFNKLTLGAKQSDIIISTPSRFMEHLTSYDNQLDLDHLQMGFNVRMEWLEVIERRSGGLTRVRTLKEIKKSRNAPRKLLLSATLSKDIEELHMWNLHRPCLFRATATKSTEINVKEHDHVTGAVALPDSITHELIDAEKAVHPLIIHKKIQASSWKRVLIFVNEKTSALRLSILLSKMASDAYKIENLTADLFGRRREKVLKRFRVGTTRVLICSDVLSRGVDVPDIDCVINYDLPKDDRLFVHRAGRTGRAGKAGALVSIGDKENKRRFKFMLKKTGLWNNITELLIGEAQVEPDMHKYQSALNELQKELSKKGEESTKSKKVSGFEHKRKRKWDPDFKEKREQEKLAKRGIWKKKKKEKKDY